MSPIKILNNYSLPFNHTEMFENFTEQFSYLIVFLLELQNLLIELLQFIADKYATTFQNNHWLALLIFFVGFYVAETIVKSEHYADRRKEAEDQIQYLKNKMKIQEGNMEFIFDNQANNELKLMKHTKQLKKLQKEINEYA